MEHIEKVCSLESELFLITICSIRILDIFEVIVKTIFPKIAKCATLYQAKSRRRLQLAFLAISWVWRWDSLYRPKLSLDRVKHLGILGVLVLLHGNQSF